MRIGANTAAARRWLGLAAHELRESEQLLNSLNVFPVADADTGTNLVLTIRTAAEAVEVLETPDIGELIMLAGQAALDEARGNSGSLFAVWLTAVGAALEGGDGVSAASLSRALQAAEVRCWSALTDPVPGTMLSVLRDIAAVPAEQERDPGSRRRLGDFLEQMVQAAHQAVLGSTEELEILRGSQRVDAGALGMLVVLEALRRAVAEDAPGRSALWAGPEGAETEQAPASPAAQQVQELLERMRTVVAELPSPGSGTPSGDRDARVSGASSSSAEGTVPSAGVEVVATVELTTLDAATVRYELSEIGDSVIASPISQVEGELWRWRIHVHVPQQHEALAILREHGKTRSISVTSLASGAGQPVAPSADHPAGPGAG